jgi:hypothetical protein
VLKCGNDLYGEPHFTKPPKPEPSKKEVPPVTIPPQGNPPEDKKLPPAPPATTTKEEEQIDLLPYLGGFVGTKIIGPEAGLIVGKHSIVSLGFGLAKRSRVHRRTHEECVSWEESMSSAKGVQPLWPCIPTEWVDEGVSFGHDFVVQAGWAYLWPKGFFAGGGLEHQERSGDFEGSSFINGKYLRVGYTRRNLIVHLDYTRSDIPDRGPVTVTRDVSWYDGQYHKLVDYTFPSISGGHDDRITVMAGWVWF